MFWAIKPVGIGNLYSLILSNFREFDLTTAVVALLVSGLWLSWWFICLFTQIDCFITPNHCLNWRQGRVKLRLPLCVGSLCRSGRRGPVTSSCSTDSNKFIYFLWHVTDLSPLYGMDKPQWQTWKVMPESSTLLSLKRSIPKLWMATSNPFSIHLT